MLLKLTPLIAVMALSACAEDERPFDPAKSGLLNPTPELGCVQLELSLGLHGDECGVLTRAEAAILSRKQANGLDTDDDFVNSN